MNGIRAESQSNGWMGRGWGGKGCFPMLVLSLWLAQIDWLLSLHTWLGVSEGRNLSPKRMEERKGPQVA